MADSKVILTDRTTAPFVAPNTLVLYMRGNTLYMRTENQEEIQVTCSASDITEIKAVTDNLPDNGALTSISDETDKISGAASTGLLETQNSVAYRLATIERNEFSGARWFETAAVPDGEDHVADRIGSGSGAFQIDAGNDTWGSWVQVLGADDTPVDTGKVYFKPYLFTVESAERNGTYLIQLTRGASGAAGYAANHYTEFVIDTNKVGGDPISIHSGRAPAGDKLWVRCMFPGADTATLDFYFGINEFEG